jgi:hypothetical protein
MQASVEGPAVVIVAYRPKPGKEGDLLQLTREHVPMLRAEGLATDHPVTEVFEWVAGGAARAHSNPKVLEMWGRYADACEIVPLTKLAESASMFASFAPIKL